MGPKYEKQKKVKEKEEEEEDIFRCLSFILLLLKIIIESM
jgi:hypothetical protein